MPENNEKRNQALEEYEQIKNNPAISSDLAKTNIVATILTIIAWVTFIGGFIMGIVYGNVEIEGYYSDYTEFSFQVAFIYWAVSFISGMMLLGFAEIIKLLEDIKNK